MRKIVIDTLGADQDASVLILGAIAARKQNSDYQLVLVGIQADIEKTLNENGENPQDYIIIDSLPLDPSIHDVMAMLRFKGHCSMVDAFDYARDHDDVAGVVSAGPTGMLLVSSIRHIGLLEGVAFPALAAMLLNIKQRNVCLVDCGANIEIREDKLFQFAQLGTALMKSYCGIESPRVGLMNVGKEETKGDSIRKAAFALFKESNLNFIGNIEGSDVFLDKCDVVACDGFSGNLILKNAEAVGLIGMKIAQMNGDEKTANMLYNMFAYNELGGAIVLGAKKVVFKAHGAANSKSIASVIADVVKLDKGNFVSNMAAQLAAKAE